MTRRQAAKADGLVWEHYDADWNIDWDYHRDDPKHLFRPWGFQPGHQTEWAKLLLIWNSAARARPPQDWLLPTATHLFDTALARAWDEQHGGICYGFAPDGRVCDDDKYFWVQAESLAAAALLHARTGTAVYRDWYEKLWAYAWRHFVDHEYGAWYRILDRGQPQTRRRKKPGRQDRLPHHGRLPRAVASVDRRLKRRRVIPDTDVYLPCGRVRHRATRHRRTLCLAGIVAAPSTSCSLPP